MSGEARPRRRAGLRAAAAALVVALGLSLGGCVTWFMPKTSDVSTPTDEHVAPALARYYHQVLHWKGCADGMQCSTATVPLDWSKPDGATISLALVRHQATGKREGSLLVNPGGPGGSGVEFVKDNLDYAVDATLRSRFDIVGFDPRGVGSSTAVKCYAPAGMDRYIYGITPGTIGSAAWIAASKKEASGFAAACEKNTGPLLAHVDTVSAAKDLDVLRAALGDTKLNYLGYSYGTYLGAVYAGLFPHKTGHLVLDGAMNPAADDFEVTEAQAEGFEKALRSYLAACIGTQGCPFTGSVDDGMRTISRMLADVAASPIRNTQDGRELGASTLLTAIIYPLYDAGAWSYLSRMFSDVMKGDAGYAFTLADAYNNRNADGGYGDNSTEAFTAINCLDYSYDDATAHMRKQAAELEKAAPVIGKYMAYGDITCAQWPYKSTVARGPIHAPGAAPILVVGTTGDPATPYAWAKSLASQLDSGHLVTYHGQGHTAYNKSNSCVDDTVDDYFVDGTVPRSDPEC